MKQGLQKMQRPFLSVLFALIVGAAVIVLVGENCISAYSILFQGAFGGPMQLGETLIKTTPLIFTALSYSFAFRCGLINIGAEGQLYIGALCSTWAGIHFQGMPAALHVALALLCGFLGGALWGGIVGFLRVRYGASEIITTVMLNYVAVLFVNYCAGGPLREPGGAYPQSAQVYESVRLIRPFEGSRLHIGLLIALCALAVYGIFFRWLPAGYEMRLVGQNQDAARYAGMNVKKDLMVAMLFSGGLGGLAGSMEILGVQFRLMQDFSSGYGFDGIAVALLGGNYPVGILLAATLFGGLRSGGNMLQMMTHVPLAMINVIQAAIILSMLVRLPKYPVLRKRRV